MLEYLRTSWFLAPATFAAVVLPPPAQAQTPPSQVNEQTMSARPIDLETNSTGSRVVVRGASKSTNPSTLDVITVWDAGSGNMVAHTDPNSPTFCGGAIAAQIDSVVSDAVRVVGDTAVLIGDIPGNSHIQIDVVDLGGTTPGCIANIAWPPQPTPPPGQDAYFVHDLDITPDGTFAVVNCCNWVLVVNLTLSPPAVVSYLNTGGSALPSWAQAPTTAHDAVDSVVVTNDWGVVVQGAHPTNNLNSFYPIVSLIDFNGPVPLIHPVDMYPVLQIGQDHNFYPHDVAITPSEDLAVVTCNGCVSLFNLSNVFPYGQGYHAATDIDLNIQRSLFHQVDSVELTSTRAVVIGTTSGEASIQVFQLRSGTPPVPTLIKKLDFVDPERNLQSHDLALELPLISGMSTAAIVHVGDDNFSSPTGGSYVIPDLEALDVTFVPPFVGSTGSPYVLGAGVQRMSDSVVTFTARVGGQVTRFAATIGSKQPDVFRGVINLVDMDTQQSSEWTTYDTNLVHETIPVDLVASRADKRVFVRCHAPPDELPPATTGRDMLVVGFNGASPFLEVGNSSQIGGRGVMDSYMMVDMIVMKRARVESISYDPNIPRGYFHTVSNP